MTSASGLARFVIPRDHRAVHHESARRAPVRATPVQSGPALGGAAGERCELCTQQLAVEHTHLVDLRTRALVCCCRPCYFLFTPVGAGAGRYRPVPDRYRYDPAFQLTPAQWDELSIPVGVLFVFQQRGRALSSAADGMTSDSDQPVAFYPSPAGATESLLSLATWARVMLANPGMADVVADVEAVLLRRVGERFDGYLVPIDACYDLVGRVRLHWRGFGGGEEVWRQIDVFFDELTRRAGAGSV